MEVFPSHNFIVSDVTIRGEKSPYTHRKTRPRKLPRGRLLMNCSSIEVGGPNRIGERRKLLRHLVPFTGAMTKIVSAFPGSIVTDRVVM
jgi:hypothetical protein